jgi:hypothetical protein
MDAEVSAQDAHASPDCPLSTREQMRNIWLFAVSTSLLYLSSPITFAIVHAPLCRRLGASAKVANLPTAAYLVATAIPVLVAWAYPQVRLIKRILLVAYFGIAAMTVLMTSALILPASDEFRIVMVVMHAGTIGITMTIAVSFLFELIGRGVSASRRGHALSLGYGIGPACAVVGNLTAQWVLPGNGDEGMIASYALLFGLSVPILCVGGLLCLLFVVPLPQREEERQPFVSGVLGGLSEYLTTPVFRRTTVVAVLMLSGYNILDNLTLYTERALDAPPEDYLGYQQSLRFGVKIVVGLIAGWLLTVASPRSVLLLTSFLGLVGITWALMGSGLWYLAAFGLFGGGELLAPYLLNYVLVFSPKAHIRRNLGFVNMLWLLAAPMGPLYGAISDHYDRSAYGFRLSIATAVVFVVLGVAMTLRLPARSLEAS